MLKVWLNSHVNAANVGFATLLDALHKFMRKDGRFDVLHEPYDAEIELYVGQPYDCFEKYWRRPEQNRLKRGIFTMFEAPEIPPQWTANLKAGFDFVVVPSHWCKETFAAAKVDLPIYVARLGIDPDEWRPPATKPNHPTFNVLWQGTLVGDRKGGDIVEKVFDEIARDDWRLFMKENPSYSKYGRTTISLAFGRGYKKRKYFVPFRRWELLRMYDFTDIAVNPTRGEGFGLIPLEQAAAGLPVAVSQSSGCLEFCDSGAFLPIACPGKDAFEFVGQICQMDLPDENDVARWLLWAYENREEARNFGLAASTLICKEWTWVKTMDALSEILSLETEIIKKEENDLVAALG